uniref:Uncharacterized protein n=1 Tax=Rhizophora mucronata TaxID=61149 RepID=A0A2P2PJS0_RHIMU
MRCLAEPNLIWKGAWRDHVYLLSLRYRLIWTYIFKI